MSQTLTRRSILRRAKNPPSIDVVHGLVETAWNARKQPGGRIQKRYRFSRGKRKYDAAQVVLARVSENKARIENMKADNLPLPGEPPERAAARAAAMRR